MKHMPEHPPGVPPTAPAPDSRARGRLLAWLAAAALTLPLVACRKAEAPKPPPPTVTVMDVAATNVSLTAEFIGQLDSPQNVEVRARVEAFVESLPFQEGTNVQQGTLLVQLDEKPFQERLAAALGILGEAQAALKKYEADVARLTPLAKAKAIPQQDLDNALASVDVGRANVKSAEAQVESARIDLGYCRITAPVSGMIGAKQVTVGSLVGKGEPTLIATISTLDPIWFYTSIGVTDYLAYERRIQETGGRVRDLPVTLITADGHEHQPKGRWVFLDRAVSTNTGTIRARAEFDNPGEILRPGMFARARMSVKQDQPSIVVPQRAVFELQGKSFVWVVTPESKTLQRPVTLGPEVGPDVIIADGLKAGERIILEGVHKVARNDTPVLAQTVAEAAAARAAGAARAAATNHAAHGKE